MLGIDIGTRFTKICKIVEDKHSNKISIASGMSMTYLDNATNQKNSIERILKSIGITSKEASFCTIEEKDIISRDINLPKGIDQENLDSAVTLAVEQSLTENLSKMLHSYTVTREISETENNILFMAVPKTKIFQRMKELSGIFPINVVGVTSEMISLVNAFNFFAPVYKETDTVVLVNIGDTNTNVVILNKKKIIFVKDVAFGGKHITKEISDMYHVPERLAEEIKRRPELWSSLGLNIRNILKRTAATLLEVIFELIEYCSTRQSILSVDRILLTGGGASLHGIDFFVKDNLGMNTEKWNPFDNENIIGIENKDLGFFMPVALGLALEKVEEQHV
ncbi:pilus assembly protein PilM [Candidatus Ruminimicrobium bovinum]|uniref:pilus assembly protein PilM n=1 Tax=Candidatus Ruminimicrobium bovinum TaxID=3242779 RepID=UPI0039B8B074